MTLIRETDSVESNTNTRRMAKYVVEKLKEDGRVDLLQWHSEW